MRTLLAAFRMLVVLSILTGIIYPLITTGVGRALFPRMSEGSLIRREGVVIGSGLLAQKTTRDVYFWPRPSGCDFATVPGGAGNLGPASAALQTAVEERQTVFGKNAPADLLTTSGSGLDPDISPEAARHQAARIAVARKMTPESVEEIIARLVEQPQFGLLGDARVNVLKLNLALDESK